MTDQVDTLIIGAGQAGLATSYLLKRQGRDHLILEKQQIGDAWRSAKWDSFTLVTPNWMLQLPGFAYDGDDPDGFLSRDEVVQHLQDYAAQFDPPIRSGVEVESIEAGDDGLIVQTDNGAFEAANVVVAVGTYQQPKTPSFSSQIAPHIQQLHSSEYRNPQELPSGAVLIAGAGQSGCQIAEELRQSGREVYLSAGRAGWLPRRYRGKDSFWWAKQLGLFDQTPADLPSPAARFAANPQVSGKDGGHTLNLHTLASDGVTLLGRLKNAGGTRLEFGEDLMENIAQGDEFATQFTKGVDKLVSARDIDVPEGELPEMRAAKDSRVITALDLDAKGITSIIWAMGYTFDYSWIKFPIFDEFGYPQQDRGVTEQPGLYFVGLHWLHTRESGLLSGVGNDAAHVVAEIAERTHERNMSSG